MDSPYKGLIPYEEEDADYFFGRDEERRIIAANLRASRLTVLYGESGVGKSSLLRAGVAYDFRDDIDYQVVVFGSWSDDPVRGLAEVLSRAVPQLGRNLSEMAYPDLIEGIKRWDDGVSAEGRRALLIILDQFEEVFQYHPVQPDPEDRLCFARQLPALLERDDLPVNVLISIREDAVASLDRFQSDIAPGLLNHRLRVEHLSQNAAKQAALGPLGPFNVAYPTRAMTMSEEVAGTAVREILQEQNGKSYEEGEKAKRVQTPTLQLILSRWWKREDELQLGVPAASRRMREEIFRDDLGGVRKIVETYLDEAMDGLDSLPHGVKGDKDLAAELFRDLVTPAGRKIAKAVSELSGATLKREDVERVLENLRLARVLTQIPAPAGAPPNEKCFEFSHDLLAQEAANYFKLHQEKTQRAQAQEKAKEANRRAEEMRQLKEAAEKAQREAVARELVAFSTLSLQDDPERSILLAMHAVDATRSHGEQAVPEAEDALHRAILKSPIRVTMPGQADAVTSVALSGDGRLAVSASRDRTLKVWEVGSGRELRTLTGHTNAVMGVALSGDGRLAVSASEDKTLKVWEVGSGRELRTLTGHTNAVMGVALSGDGRLAVSASADHMLKVWEVGSGRELRTLTGHTGAVSGVALSGDGRLAVSASHDQALKVWEVGSGRELHTLTGHTGSVNGVAVSGDGRLAVSASVDHMLKVWEVGSGRALRTLTGHTLAVNGVAVSGDGRLAVSASTDQTLKVWEVGSGRALRTLTGHTRWVNSVAVSGDGRLAVSASIDKTLKVWEVGRGRELRALTGHTSEVNSVALSGDGRLAVSASWDQTLKVWEVGSGRELHTLAGHTGYVNGVALSGDGRLAVSASIDKTLKVWEVGRGRELRTLTGHTNAVMGVALSGDGRLAVSASTDQTLKVWEVASGRALRTLTGHTAGVMGVALSGDGRLAVSASTDQTLKVWEVASGRALRTLTGHTDSVAGVAVSGDGRLAVSASTDQTLKVWEVASGRELRTLTGHTNAVTSVALSGDGRLAVSASGDQTLKVWEVGSGRELMTLQAYQAFGWVALSRDGKVLLSGTDEGIIQVYAMDIDLLLSLARSRVTRNLTDKESEKYLHREVVPELPGSDEPLKAWYEGRY